MFFELLKVLAAHVDDSKPPDEHDNTEENINDYGRTY